MPPLESLRGASAAPALEAPVRRKRMLLVSNPYATTVSGRLTSLVVYALQGRYDVDAADTEGRDHATQLAREAAAEGYDVVVAFGGDGTVNEAANGLAGSATALYPLPGGATNVYCRMLGIPNDVVDATEHLLRVADEWNPRRLRARRRGRPPRRRAPRAQGAPAPLVLRVVGLPDARARLHRPPAPHRR